MPASRLVLARSTTTATTGADPLRPLHDHQSGQRRRRSCCSCSAAVEPRYRGNPGFQGYIIAQCRFQYAHGFAFITDGPIGQARVAEGYLALVMDDGIVSRTGSRTESLLH